LKFHKVDIFIYEEGYLNVVRVAMEMNIEVKSVRLKEWWLDRIENDMKVAGVNKGVKG